jgi:hypothetical protein
MGGKEININSGKIKRRKSKREREREKVTVSFIPGSQNQHNPVLPYPVILTHQS